MNKHYVRYNLHGFVFIHKVTLRALTRLIVITVIFDLTATIYELICICMGVCPGVADTAYVYNTYSFCIVSRVLYPALYHRQLQHSTRQDSRSAL